MSKETEAEIARMVDEAEEILDPIERLLDEVAEDANAAFRPEMVAELVALKQDDEATYEETRSKLKAAGVRVTALDGAIRRFLKDGSSEPTQVDAILGLTADFELFHSRDRTAYADIDVEECRQTYPICGKAFGLLLKARLYKETSQVATPEAIRKAIDLLEARAQFEGPEREVYIRVGSLNGQLYIDLGNDDWSAVEINQNGWGIINTPPVRFCRFPGMGTLPTPIGGASIEILRRHLNVRSQSDFVLAVSWLVAALRHPGPYPVLVLSGEQGSAKSTFAKFLRELVDPYVAPLRTLPRDERDLFIAAKHMHVLAFDNLSGLPLWLSDSLCRFAMGGGHAARRLYTDEDEFLFEAQRPVILNGIEQMIPREDLADRAIFIALNPISRDRRVSEHQLRVSFEEDKAAIFGALLEMMVQGLRALPEISPPELPRMADFAIWASACEGAGWRRGTFEEAYRGNREEAVEAVVDADPVASSIQELMARTMRTMQTPISPNAVAPVEWKGTASELLQELRTIATDTLQRDGNWPKTAVALSNRLNRATPFLRECGIEVIRTREGHDRTRVILIRILGDSGKTLTASSASSARETETYRSGSDEGHRVEEDTAVDCEELMDAEPREGSPLSLFASAESVNSVSTNPPKPKGIIIKRPQKKVDPNPSTVS